MWAQPLGEVGEVKPETGLYHVRKRHTKTEAVQFWWSKFIQIKKNHCEHDQFYRLLNSRNCGWNMTPKLTAQTLTWSLICTSLHVYKYENADFFLIQKPTSQGKGKKCSTLVLSLTLSHTHIRGQCGAWKITGLYHSGPEGGFILQFGGYSSFLFT